MLLIGYVTVLIPIACSLAAPHVEGSTTLRADISTRVVRDRVDEKEARSPRQLVLVPQNVQNASQFSGDLSEPGQSSSLTDDVNFINFCSGKVLTNGAQIDTGSCNGIVMGDIPARGNMVSSIIVHPQPGQAITAHKQFDIIVQVSNLQAGDFTNPDQTYYTAPQQLRNGKIVGHVHVTVQDLGHSLMPQIPPDPTSFVFFKGINDAGNGQGLLSATVENGLGPGFYRVCTMNSGANHQPVIMPVAQRGAQDDCTKFSVSVAAAEHDSNTASAGGSQVQASSNTTGSKTLP